MLQAGYNDLIVTIDKKFNDEIQLKSGVKLHVATQYDEGEHANVIGKVVSVPLGIQPYMGLDGMSTAGIDEGDTVIMRYDVIASYSKQPERSSSTHRYEIFYKGQSFWRCSIAKAFAVVKKDGEMRMLNGYVMIEPFEKATNLILPGHVKMYQKGAKSKVMHIGEPRGGEPKLPVKTNDVVYFDPRIAQWYKISEKPYCIIRQSHIQGYEF